MSRGKTYTVGGMEFVVSYLPGRGAKPPRVGVATVEGRQVGYWDLHRCIAVSHDPAEASEVFLAAEAWEQGKPTERDLFRMRPQRRPSQRASSAPVVSQNPSGSSPSKTMALLPEPDSRHDLARNKPAQQLLKWRRSRVRQSPLRVAKGFFDGVGDDDYRRRTLGIRGEQKVAKELKAFIKRRHGWHVIHSVTISDKGTDMDHLVIGPAGIYTINTKNWSGRKITARNSTVRTFRDDGTTRYGEGKTIRAARNESSKAQDLLSTAVGQPVTVQPMVVFVGAVEVIDALSADGVRLLSDANLQSWFDAQDATAPKYTPVQVAALYNASRHPTTWRPQQKVASSPNS